MAKKFTVVGGSPEPDPIGMPTGLEAAGATLWRQCTTEYDISDCAGAAMLEAACRALDRAERCRKIIDADGEVTMTRAGPREHCLLKCELASRAFTVRTLARLGLSFEPLRSHSGRPPGFA
jgi:hypothetical protein